MSFLMQLLPHLPPINGTVLPTVNGRNPDCHAWMREWMERFATTAEGQRIVSTYGNDMGMAGFYMRQEFVQVYGWWIPDARALQLIQRYSPHGVIEIGAGLGYAAFLLRHLGVGVLAYDAHPVETGRNHYHNGHAWTQVLEGDVNALLGSDPNLTLLLAWPPYEDPMGHQALSLYRGNTVIYVGEFGGCTGDAKFHRLLTKEWNEVEDYSIPQHAGLHDSLYVYQRKSPLRVK